MHLSTSKFLGFDDKNQKNTVNIDKIKNITNDEGKLANSGATYSVDFNYFFTNILKFITSESCRIVKI